MQNNLKILNFFEDHTMKKKIRHPIRDKLHPNYLFFEMLENL